MNIGLDYDDTYSADPELWDAFIDRSIARKHAVYLVTCRRDTPENREDVYVSGIAVHRHIFTGLAAKKWFCEELGIKIDVWIDNNPESIVRGM